MSDPVTYPYVIITRARNDVIIVGGGPSLAAIQLASIAAWPTIEEAQADAGALLAPAGILTLATGQNGSGNGT